MLGQWWGLAVPEAAGAGAVWPGILEVVGVVDDVVELAALAIAAPPPTAAPVIARVTSRSGILRRMSSPPFLGIQDTPQTIPASGRRPVGRS